MFLVQIGKKQCRIQWIFNLADATIFKFLTPEQHTSDDIIGNYDIYFSFGQKVKAFIDGIQGHLIPYDALNVVFHDFGPDSKSNPVGCE